MTGERGTEGWQAHNLGDDQRERTSDGIGVPVDWDIGAWMGMAVVRVVGEGQAGRGNNSQGSRFALRRGQMHIGHRSWIDIGQ